MPVDTVEDSAELYFYRARYLNVAYGRFLSEDPLEFEGGQNLYAYVHDSPLSFVDPDGTCECSVDIKCRSVHDFRAQIIGAVHCYVVVKGTDRQYVTLTGGPEKNGVLRAWAIPWSGDTDPSQGNSAADESVYRSVGEGQTCNDVDCMKRKQGEFDGLGLKYNATRGPNSNTFVAWSVSQCGLSAVLPVSAIGRGAQVR